MPQRQLESRAQTLMREQFGHADFQPGQWEPMRALLAGRDAIVVMPTGSGKSLIYQLPALMLEGLTVVVTPLIALMKDQQDKLNACGVEDRKSTRLNSSHGYISYAVFCLKKK